MKRPSPGVNGWLRHTTIHNAKSDEDKDRRRTGYIKTQLAEISKRAECNKNHVRDAHDLCNAVKGDKDRRRVECIENQLHHSLRSLPSDDSHIVQSKLDFDLDRETNIQATIIHKSLLWY